MRMKRITSSDMNTCYELGGKLHRNNYVGKCVTKKRELCFYPVMLWKLIDGHLHFWRMIRLVDECDI